MKNLDVKSDKITVGVALQGDPQIEMKNQKGITLIALIITIIVMLILVGVTINVALNGGLFQKADEAKRLTQLESDKEELQIEAATTYNEKTREVEFSKLETNLSNKDWAVTISGDNAICTSPKGNTFTLDKNGKIIENNEYVQEDRTYVGNLNDATIIVNLSSNNELTITIQGMVIADKIKPEEVSAPEGLENPENYSNFYKYTAEGTEVICGISKDGKTVTVVGMGNLTLVDRKEGYPRVYSTPIDGYGQRGHIIELSENERIEVFELGEQVVARRLELEIKECSDIKTLKEEFKSLQIYDEANLEYTKILVNANLLPVYAYFPSVDAWTGIGTRSESGALNGFTINQPAFFYNWNMTNEQINTYIQAAQ